jgi:hypothetical protein
MNISTICIGAQDLIIQKCDGCLMYNKDKVKLSLFLIMYHAMKTYLLFNKAPCHDVLGEWMYSSTHS